MPDPILWLIIIILVALSAFFSATETAFSTFNKFRMKVRADEGSKTAKLICKIDEKFDRTLITVLIGNNIVAIFVSSISTMLFLKYFSSIGLENYASLVSTIIMTIVVYLLGDTIPKTIAKQIPDKLVYVFAYPIYCLYIILWPIAFLFDLFSQGVSKLFKMKEEPTMTEEDFSNVIEEVEKEGVLEHEEGEIIQSALDFTDTTVGQVLTPKSKMYSIDIEGLSHEKLNAILLSTSFSRIPVYEGNKDNIIGVLNVKTYLRDYLKDSHISIRNSLKKPYFVTPKIMLDDLFDGLKQKRTHIAFVVDDNKKLVGMVTMEDILEEIVTDIAEPVSQNKNAMKGSK